MRRKTQSAEPLEPRIVREELLRAGSSRTNDSFHVKWLRSRPIAKSTLAKGNQINLSRICAPFFASLNGFCISIIFI